MAFGRKEQSVEVSGEVSAPVDAVDALAEKKRALAEKSRERRAKEKIAFRAILMYARSASDPAIIDACAQFAEKRAAAPRARTNYLLSAISAEGGAQIHEDNLFLRYHLGRSEAHRLIRSAINAPADKRAWIRFDMPRGLYILDGMGAEPPAGWTGPMLKEGKAE